MRRTLPRTCSRGTSASCSSVKTKTGDADEGAAARMRKTAFARIYAADKNMSMFLGRPCRINGRFCHFQVPSNGVDAASVPQDPGAPLNGNIWAPDEEMNYIADTKWSAVSALLKEEILELFRDTDKEKQLRKAG